MQKQPTRGSAWRCVILSSALLLTLSTLSACASDQPVLRGLDYCETYEPVFDVDHPVVIRNNAVYFEFCLAGGRHV